MLRCFLAAVLVHGAAGYGAFGNKIPNGGDVPCYDGATGCMGNICKGVGHMSCSGGDARNPFGLAFKAASFDWTAVCQQDDDADGFTNGEELGDPCCTWTEGSASAMQAMSHPGVATSFPASREGFPNCGGEEPEGEPEGEQEGEEPEGEALPPCLLIGTGFWCGEGGCDCDTCCGTPWKPESQDCCHSHCQATERPDVYTCEGQRCSSTAYPAVFEEVENTGCGSLSDFVHTFRECSEGRCSMDEYSGMICGGNKKRYEKLGCDYLNISFESESESESESAAPPPNKIVTAKCADVLQDYLTCIEGNSHDPEYSENRAGAAMMHAKFLEALQKPCVDYETFGCENWEEAVFQSGGDTFACKELCGRNHSCTGGAHRSDGCYLFGGSPMEIVRQGVEGSPNRGLSWQMAHDQAEARGLRLPTSAEFENFDISDGDFDQWQPVADGRGVWIQSGDAGRLHVLEGDESSDGWHMNDDVHQWRPTTPGTENSSPVHHFYAVAGGETRCKRTPAGQQTTGEAYFACSAPAPVVPKGPERPDEGDCVVLLYDECHGDGPGVQLGMGEHELHGMGIGDMVESLKVLGSNCYARLWEHSKNMGDDWVFEEGEFDCHEFEQRADSNSASFVEVTYGYPGAAPGPDPGPGGHCARTADVPRTTVARIESQGWSVRRCA